MNDSDLDSVTLKAYKVKDCGRNMGSDNCMWNAKKTGILGKKYQVKLKIPNL